MSKQSQNRDYLFFVFLLFHFGFKADKRNHPCGLWIYFFCHWIFLFSNEKTKIGKQVVFYFSVFVLIIKKGKQQEMIPCLIFFEGNGNCEFLNFVLFFFVTWKWSYSCRYCTSLNIYQILVYLFNFLFIYLFYIFSIVTFKYYLKFNICYNLL